jgi:hypothetical protein
MRVLLQAIRKGEPVNSGWHMADATLATVMGQISCFTGKEVTWKQAAASGFHYGPAPEECTPDMAPPVVHGPDGLYPCPKPGLTKEF